MGRVCYQQGSNCFISVVLSIKYVLNCIMTERLLSLSLRLLFGEDNLFHINYV